MKRKIPKIKIQQRKKKEKYKKKVNIPWVDILIGVFTSGFIFSLVYVMIFSMILDNVSCPSGYQSVEFLNINKTNYRQCDPIKTVEKVIQDNKIVKIEHESDGGSMLVSSSPARWQEILLFCAAGWMVLTFGVGIFLAVKYEA